MTRSKRAVRKKPTIKSWNGEWRIWIQEYDVITQSKMENFLNKKVHSITKSTVLQTEIHHVKPYYYCTIMYYMPDQEDPRYCWVDQKVKSFVAHSELAADHFCNVFGSACTAGVLGADGIWGFLSK